MAIIRAAEKARVAARGTRTSPALTYEVGPGPRSATTESAGDAASPLHTVALVLSIALLAWAQIALVSRSLFARQDSAKGQALSPGKTELIWVLAPGVLLAALVLYSLLRAREL